MSITQRRTDPGEVAQAIVDRLIAVVPNLGDGNCYLADDPDEVPPITYSEYAVVVTPDRNFRIDPALWGGHPTLDLTVYWGMVTTIHRLTPSIDQPGRASYTLFATTGLGPIATQVLGALSGHMLFVAGEGILSQGLRPDNGVWDRKPKRQNLLQLNWEAMFRWQPSQDLPEVWP